MVLGNHWKVFPDSVSAYQAGIGFPIGQSVANVKTMIEFAKKKKKGTISMEIGTRNGGSALIWAMHTFDPVVTIDMKKDPRLTHWPDKDGKETRLYKDILPLPNHWARYPGGGRIEFIGGVISWDLDISMEKRPVGLLFIDGDHSYEGLKKDWEHFYPLVCEGGFIVIDDYGTPGFPGVSKFLEQDVALEPIEVNSHTMVVYCKEEKGINDKD
jgi:predicted O-methyltransferase YrrM